MYKSRTAPPQLSILKDRQGVSARILVQLQTFDNPSISVNVICVNITT